MLQSCTCTHSFLWTFPGAVWLLCLLVCSRLWVSSVSWWALLQTSADESQHKKEHEQRAAECCLSGEGTHNHIRRWFAAHRGRKKNCCQLQLSLSFIHWVWAWDHALQTTSWWAVAISLWFHMFWWMTETTRPELRGGTLDFSEKMPEYSNNVSLSSLRG